MDQSKADLLLHPIRLRIVLAMAGEERTTAELRDELADVAPATLYRHVAALYDGGILEVVDERRNRGGVERRYRLVEAEATIGREDAAAMSLDQHLSAFVTFAGVLIDAMTRYTRHRDAAPVEHPLGYHQVPLWLTNSEAEALANDLTEVIERYRENEPTDDRTKVAFNTILIPELG